MKLELLKETEFRGEFLGEGSIKDFPLGVANQMLLNGIAKKASPDAEEKTVGKEVDYKKLNVGPLTEYAISIGVEIPDGAKKADILALVEEKLKEGTK